MKAPDLERIRPRAGGLRVGDQDTIEYVQRLHPISGGTIAGD